MVNTQLLTPYLDPHDLQAIEHILKFGRPRDCLEWGSGGSTVYFPNKFRFIKSWLSYEHDPGWYHVVRKQVSKKVELKLVSLNDYVFDVFKRKKRFDFIFIDGILRGSCLLAGSLLIKKRVGGCVLHDTGRSEYHRWFSVFRFKKQLTKGNATGNGITLFWN